MGSQGKPPGVTAEEREKLDPASVAALYQQYGEELRRFLVGIVRDIHLANDLVQATFVKAVEIGHNSREESRKAWLFQVAFHEAMLDLRRRKTGQRVTSKVAWARQEECGPADERVLRFEKVEAVRLALKELPPDQQQIVRMRIYEEKTFAVIAQELQIPLGTALGRMRIAVEKLRQKLDATP